MKIKLLILAGALALIAVTGKYYAVPVMAQVRAALVSDVDNPAKNFVRFAVGIAPSGTSSCFATGYTVQPGKRLVIDDISAQISVSVSSAGAMYIELTSNAHLCGPGVRQRIAVVPFSFQGTDGLGHVSAAHELMQVYFETGETVGGVVVGSGGSSLSGVVYFSGHLVSIP